MVGRSNYHGLDITILQDLSIVAVAFGFSLRQGQSLLQVGLVNVAGSNYLNLRVFLKISQIHAAHATATDEPYANSVVGCDGRCLLSKTGNPSCRSNCRTSLDELPSIHFLSSDDG